MAAEPKSTAGDDRVLPPEIWTEILIRLPAKSILRCRSVCKSWYSLISSPNFISDYSLRNPNRNGDRVLLQSDDYYSGSGFPLSSHDESFTESREHDEVPDAFLGSNVKIVGSCNGLICLSKRIWCNNDQVMRFLIWNPTVRKVVELPSRSSCNAREFSYYGFGFDFKTGDYKVMCTIQSHFDRKNCDCSDADANECAIFDLEKGVWRSISPLVHSWYVRGGPPECYLDGTVHWSGYRHVESSDMILLSFDMSDETFRELRMPDCAEFLWNGDGDDDSLIETRSVTLGGLIHVIVWKYVRNDYAQMKCSVLAMKEYGVAESWTILFNLDLLCAELCLCIAPNKFRLCKNGEVLMVHDLPGGDYNYYDDDFDRDEDMGFGDRQELVSYNTETRECKQLLMPGFCVLDLCLYKESLVLM